MAKPSGKKKPKPKANSGQVAANPSLSSTPAKPGNKKPKGKK